MKQCREATNEVLVATESAGPLRQHSVDQRCESGVALAPLPIPCDAEGERRRVCIGRHYGEGRIVQHFPRPTDTRFERKEEAARITADMRRERGDVGTGHLVDETMSRTFDLVPHPVEGRRLGCAPRDGQSMTPQIRPRHRDPSGQRVVRANSDTHLQFGDDREVDVRMLAGQAQQYEIHLVAAESIQVAAPGTVQGVGHVDVYVPLPLAALTESVKRSKMLGGANDDPPMTMRAPAF